MSEPLPRALIDHASAYFRPAGPFAWRFARGKLRADPAFRAILAHGLLAPAQHLLDLGAGQGLLAACLLASAAWHADPQRHPWPRSWPPPPHLKTYTGIEINPSEVRRARRAFALDAGAAVRMVHGDIRVADYGTPDAIVLLDVLHYNGYATQEAILARVRAALPADGVLVLRVGDADGGVGCALSQAFDRTVALARRGRWARLHVRPLARWQELLRRVGFRVRTVPLASARVLRNALLVAHCA